VYPNAGKGGADLNAEKVFSFTTKMKFETEIQTEESFRLSKTVSREGGLVSGIVLSVERPGAEVG